MLKAFTTFIGYYVAIVVFVYGLLPLGALVLVLGRLVYGSWDAAFTTWWTHVGMAATSIFGLIPVYGNKLHYDFAASHLLPWAASRGVGNSWLLSTAGTLATLLAAMCPGALLFPMFENKTGRVPLSVLLLGLAVLVVGTLWGSALFFNVAR